MPPQINLNLSSCYFINRDREPPEGKKSNHTFALFTVIHCISPRCLNFCFPELEAELGNWVIFVNWVFDCVPRL